jgi:hypothetical protein
VKWPDDVDSLHCLLGNLKYDVAMREFVTNVILLSLKPTGRKATRVE